MRVHATSSSSKHFSRGVNNSIRYKVPSIREYRMALLFMREALAELEDSVPCLMYTTMGDIQKDHVVSSISIIVTSRALILGLFRVSWMK